MEMVPYLCAPAVEMEEADGGRAQSWGDVTSASEGCPGPQEQLGVGSESVPDSVPD